MAITLAVELILLDTLIQRVLNAEEGKCVLEAPNVNSRNWAGYHLSPKIVFPYSYAIYSF